MSCTSIDCFFNLFLSLHSSLELFALCVIIYILGILYIIFVLQEVKASPAKTSELDKPSGVDNPAFDSNNDSNNGNMEIMKKNASDATTATAEITNRGFLREFFDLTLTLQLVDVIVKKRAGNLRTLIWIVLLTNVIFLASLGESDLTYLYTRLKLNWDGKKFLKFINFYLIVFLRR